jgi:hypothetical protein
MRRVLFLACLLAAFPGFLYAECKCPPQTPQDLIEQATYVFNGEVWDVELAVRDGPQVITFDVNDTFKGDPKPRIEIQEDADKDCAIDFHEGESYLVYARWRWGSTKTSRCWGTKRLQDAASDGAALGPGGVAMSKYFDQLQVHCMGRRDTVCCLDSLKIMRRNRYLPQPESGCPEEMIPDRLRCDGSYVWCAPVTAPRLAPAK